MLKKPRGTRDFPPDEMERRRELLEELRSTAESYGYREIGLPTFEHMELFTLKSGEGIKEQIYFFRDKSGRELALRPEMTASAMRVYVSKFQNLPKPLKIYYYGNCFRYERPQKGRFREFWQFGVEFIGSSRAFALAELVVLARDMMMRAGLREFDLRIGYLDILNTILGSVSMPENARSTTMVLIDKNNQQGLEDLLYENDCDPRTVSDILHLLDDGSVEEKLRMIRDMTDRYPGLHEKADRFQEFIDSMKILGDNGFSVDLSIVRGLDYYTGMVFEIHVDGLGAESQVCGGGEYSLVPLFGGREVSTGGFAVGFDRVLLALESEGYDFGKWRLDVYLVPISSDEIPFCAGIAALLREAGFRVDMETRGRNLGKTMKYVNSIGARFAGIIGETEVKEQCLTLKDMETGKQEIVRTDEVVERLRSR